MTAWIQVDCREMSPTRAKRDFCQTRVRAGKGDVIEIISTLQALPKWLRGWCNKMGDGLVRTEHVGRTYVTQIEVSKNISRCR